MSPKDDTERMVGYPAHHSASFVDGSLYTLWGREGPVSLSWLEGLVAEVAAYPLAAVVCAYSSSSSTTSRALSAYNVKRGARGEKEGGSKREEARGRRVVDLVAK